MSLSQPPAAVLFDVADTLLYKAGLFEAIAATLDAAGIVRDPREIRAVHTALRENSTFPDRTDRAFYEGFNNRLIENLGGTPKGDLAHGIYLACRSLPWRAFADVSALAALDLPLGIVSNWDDRLAGILAQHIAISFDPVVVSGIEGVAKPNLKIFDIALSRTRAGSRRVFFVGDSPVLDIAPAKAAGLEPILIDRFGLYGDFPGLRISSLEQLREILSH